MATVIISPYNVVNFPEGGGHCWVYLQYVLGLRQWGCDVYWLEQLRPRGDLREDEALLATFFSKLEDFGLREKIILYAAGEDAASSDAPIRYVGMRRAKAEALMSRADLLLNFHYAISPARLARFLRTSLVDIDPGLLQFWVGRRELSVPLVRLPAAVHRAATRARPLPAHGERQPGPPRAGSPGLAGEGFSSTRRHARFVSAVHPGGPRRVQLRQTLVPEVPQRMD